MKYIKYIKKETSLLENSDDEHISSGLKTVCV